MALASSWAEQYHRFRSSLRSWRTLKLQDLETGAITVPDVEFACIVAAALVAVAAGPDAFEVLLLDRCLGLCFVVWESPKVLPPWCWPDRC